MENEKSKSFWKKPLSGRRLLLIWLILSAAIAVVFAIGGLPTNYAPVEASYFPGALIISAVCSAIVIGVCKFIHWLYCWRNLKRFFFAVACLITLIALFYAEENWRGKHAWKNFKREQEAKGERLDFASIVPPPVPDEQNFAMTPIWVEEISANIGVEKGRIWYGGKVAALGHTNFVRRLLMPVELWDRSGLEFTNKMRGWQQAEKTDLKAWQEYYRRLATVTNVFPVPAQSQTPAEDVLLALSKYDSTIKELRKASQLPYARFPLTYDTADPASILLPHLASLKGCSRTLQLRALAELQAGQTERAFDDIKLTFRLIESAHTEPTVISQLVRNAMLQIIFQPIWEGLADHRWTEAQLAAFEAELGKLDFLADCQAGLHWERNFAVTMIDYLRGSRNEIKNIMDFSDKSATSDSSFQFQLWLAHYAPGGWLERNKIACCRMSLELLTPIVNLETRTASPANAVQATNAGNGIKLSPYNWITRLMIPGLSRSSEKFARAQSSVDLARIACALERYRLAHGGFPESLDPLTPQFIEKIPHDVIGGQPLHYHRTDDGQFVLYSIGWNEKDDGGIVALTKGRETEYNTDYENGDWVWRYPAK